MTRDELREKVARAIAGAEIAYFGPKSSFEQCMNWAHEPDCYRQAADAAIAVVMEEAARVVEATPYEFKITGAPPGSIEVIDTSKTVAAALRAYVSK